MSIRLLTPEDAESYRMVRLAALREHPEAFATDLCEETELPFEEFQKRLLPNGESNQTFGAFHEQQLIGIGTLLRSTRVRQRFRATIVGMYVLPAHRRQGAATKLLTVCIDRAHGMEGVEEVCLCITVGNDAARRAYVAFGFQAEFIEPRYFKFEGRYYDLEWLRLSLS